MAETAASGSLRGQTVVAAEQEKLAAALPAAVEHALTLGEDDLQSFCPMLAILGARHEIQYSRLFRS